MNKPDSHLLNPERVVIKDLENRGFRCESFSKYEVGKGKTPDYRVYRSGQFSVFLEIKEIAQDPWLGGGRRDPIPNRLTDDIHTAVKQFNAVNPDLVDPNVLAFVNNDERCGTLDLTGMVTGSLLLEGGGSTPIYTNYAQGRIRDEKHRIHLYLWYDVRKANQAFFNMVDRRHLARLCGYFGLNPDQIPTIGA